MRDIVVKCMYVLYVCITNGDGGVTTSVKMDVISTHFCALSSINQITDEVYKS